MRNAGLASSVLALLMLLVSCATAPTFRRASKVYRGMYHVHTLGVDFIPEGTDRIWCLTGALGNLHPASFDVRDTESPELPSGNLVVRGRLSRPGEYGHGGIASRMLQVQEIISLTRFSSSDTEPPGAPER